MDYLDKIKDAEKKYLFRKGARALACRLDGL
jgi:hypothetical protein